MRVSIPILACAAAALSLAVPACGDDGADTTSTTLDDSSGDGDGDGDGPMTPQSCLDAIGQDSTDFVEAQVFQSCTFSACHDASNPEGGLDLTAGQVLANTVGVASKTTGTSLVTAGDPNNSYLLVVMDHVSGTDLQGRTGRLEGTLPSQGTMPEASPLLCQEKRDAVAAWITGLD